jgi:RNA polymerase sigma-70 factor (ECF subfamily)
MLLDAMTDEQLVLQTLQRKEAFGVLVRRYDEKLMRYIRRLGVFRREDAEDVLQNTFIKAYRNLNGFDSGLKFSSWIYRITHNEAMSFFRSRKARPEGSLVGDSEEMLEILPSVLDIEEEAGKSIDGAVMRDALYALDPKYRDVLVLRYFEEREYAEISDILQVPVSTVGTLISRAKKKLKERFNHDPR